MAAKPQTLATTSAFEVLGPVMVGPSSSHTAGALRCARVAASLMGGRVARVRFTLWNSFAHTYRGHGTDRALVAGVLGLDTDDERIRDAFDLAREAGLAFEFVEAGDDTSVHPNTVDIDLEGEGGARCQVRGESLGGGKMRISRINGVGVDITGAYATLFVSHKDAPGILASLTHLLAMAEVNIAFCRTYRTEQGGRAYSVFETDGAPDDSVLPMIRRIRDVSFATFISRVCMPVFALAVFVLAPKFKAYLLHFRARHFSWRHQRSLLRMGARHLCIHKPLLRRTLGYSWATALQQTSLYIGKKTGYDCERKAARSVS